MLLLRSLDHPVRKLAVSFTEQAAWKKAARQPCRSPSPPSHPLTHQVADPYSALHLHLNLQLQPTPSHLLQPTHAPQHLTPPTTTTRPHRCQPSAGLHPRPTRCPPLQATRCLQPPSRLHRPRLAHQPQRPTQTTSSIVLQLLQKTQRQR